MPPLSSPPDSSPLSPPPPPFGDEEKTQVYCPSVDSQDEKEDKGKEKEGRKVAGRRSRRGRLNSLLEEEEEEEEEVRRGGRRRGKREMASYGGPESRSSGFYFLPSPFFFSFFFLIIFFSARKSSTPSSNRHWTQQPRIFFTSHAVDKTGKIELYVKKLQVTASSLLFPTLLPLISKFSPFLFPSSLISRVTPSPKLAIVQ